MRRTTRIPLTAEELTPINARLREAYRMVDEVGGLIHGRVKSALETKHRNMLLAAAQRRRKSQRSYRLDENGRRQ